MKMATAALRWLDGAPRRGFPLGRLIVSPPLLLLIHAFHPSSNEPSAVWHLSGHLRVGPCTVHESA